MRIKREDFIQELQEEMYFRNIIREGINIVESKILQEENQLRQIVKSLIYELKTKNLKQHETTGMNALEHLISVTSFSTALNNEYNKLTTSKDQRDSFFQHILNAVENMFGRDELNRIPDEIEQEEQDKQTELKKEMEKEKEPESELPISPKAVDLQISESFLKEDKKGTTGSFTVIPGLNRTGAIRAKVGWNQVEELIAAELQGLPEEEDRQEFNLEGKENPETGEWIEGIRDQWEEQLSGNVNRPQR